MAVNASSVTADHHVFLYVMRDFVRVMLVLVRIRRNIRRVVHSKIKKRENKNPNQINKMPEQAGNFNAVGQVFRIPLVKPFAHRQPHVSKDNHATEHV